MPRLARQITDNNLYNLKSQKTATKSIGFNKRRMIKLDPSGEQSADEYALAADKQNSMLIADSMEP